MWLYGPKCKLKALHQLAGVAGLPKPDLFTSQLFAVSRLGKHQHPKGSTTIRTSTNYARNATTLAQLSSAYCPFANHDVSKSGAVNALLTIVLMSLRAGVRISDSSCARELNSSLAPPLRPQALRKVSPFYVSQDVHVAVGS